MFKGLFKKECTVTVEIERKFLILFTPDAKPTRCHKIRQGYIAREAGNAVRIRRLDDLYILSVKTPEKGIGRYEIETSVTADEGEILFSACPHAPIEKVREVYVIGDHVWEVDIFAGRNKGLIVAEVELSSQEQAIVKPEWIGPEVTGFQKFYNASLSQVPFENWGVKYADLVARMGDDRA